MVEGSRRRPICSQPRLSSTATGGSVETIAVSAASAPSLAVWFSSRLPTGIGSTRLKCIQDAASASLGSGRCSSSHAAPRQARILTQMLVSVCPADEAATSSRV